MSSLAEIRRHRADFASERDKQAREKETAIAAIGRQVAEGREFKDFPPKSQALILSMSPAAWSAVENRIRECEKELAAEMKAAQARKVIL